MTDSQSVPEWNFDPNDFNARDMHQLPSTPAMLPKDIKFLVRVHVIGYDSVLDKYRICLYKDGGHRNAPWHTLSNDDTNVKACVVRVCHTFIGRTPDAICTALPTKHEKEGEVLVFAYVAYLKDFATVKGDAEHQWLLPMQLEPILVSRRSGPGNRLLVTECQRAFSAFEAARQRQSQT